MQVSCHQAEVDEDKRSALLNMLTLLQAAGYHFTTATPATHVRVVKRGDRQQAKSLRDVLGWSLPFDPQLIPRDIMRAMEAADVVTVDNKGRMVATVRVSSVRDNLYLHSAYPTTAVDSVFLGPDSYRFADLIISKLDTATKAGRILDYGAGAGVGGITAACHSPGARLTLADINPKALFLASINAEFAGIDHVAALTRSPDELTPGFDVIVTHPPFMMDSDARAYRHGGDLYGARLSLDWVLAGMTKLSPGGRLVLHTGVSIVEGRDVFLEQIRAQVGEQE